MREVRVNFPPAFRKPGFDPPKSVSRRAAQVHLHPIRRHDAAVPVHRRQRIAQAFVEAVPQLQLVPVGHERAREVGRGRVRPELDGPVEIEPLARGDGHVVLHVGRIRHRSGAVRDRAPGVVEEAEKRCLPVRERGAGEPAHLVAGRLADERRVERVRHFLRVRRRDLRDRLGARARRHQQREAPGEIERLLRREVQRAADPLAVHVGRRRLLHLHAAQQLAAHHVQRNEAASAFGFGVAKRHAVDRDVVEARTDAANLDEPPFAFLEQHRHAGDAVQRLPDVLVGQPPDFVRIEGVHDAIGLALHGDRARVVERRSAYDHGVADRDPERKGHARRLAASDVHARTRELLKAGERRGQRVGTRSQLVRDELSVRVRHDDPFAAGPGVLDGDRDAGEDSARFVGDQAGDGCGGALCKSGAGCQQGRENDDDQYEQRESAEHAASFDSRVAK